MIFARPIHWLSSEKQENQLTTGGQVNHSNLSLKEKV